MVARIRIGSLFGSKGIFVSKPGKDVTIPGSQLLMDTRYEYLQVHAAGRFDLNYDYQFPLADPGQHETGNAFTGSTTFPPLGYVPMHYVSLALQGAWIGNADNNSWYPCMSSVNAPGYGTMPGNSNYGDILQYGYKVGDGTIDVGMSLVWDTLEQQWSDPMKVDYIIFKKPAA